MRVHELVNANAKGTNHIPKLHCPSLVKAIELVCGSAVKLSGPLPIQPQLVQVSCVQPEEKVIGCGEVNEGEGIIGEDGQGHLLKGFGHAGKGEKWVIEKTLQGELVEGKDGVEVACISVETVSEGILETVAAVHAQIAAMSHQPAIGQRDIRLLTPIPVRQRYIRVVPPKLILKHHQKLSSPDRCIGSALGWVLVLQVDTRESVD